MPHDADNLSPRHVRCSGFPIEVELRRHLTADRILIAPKPAGEGVVDDDDGCSVLAVARLEPSPAQQAHAHGLEVARRDVALVGLDGRDV